MKKYHPINDRNEENKWKVTKKKKANDIMTSISNVYINESSNEISMKESLQYIRPIFNDNESEEIYWRNENMIVVKEMK